ncbi:unnamed protein product [Spirodela intermedia]|uniref:Antimicrobial peptide 1 n=1 Tax=Spirodela intermedia TaxID=51605 RepID=A0ABN7E7U2_SPIIN|nr:unnamed protein product [Spirodela intermedia]
MATTCKTPVSPAAAVLLFLIAAAALAPASASRITTYAVPGCKGRSLTWRCGACHNFGIYNKGYFFDYTGGQIALFYYSTGCQGRYETLASDTIRCYLRPYKSIRIIC